MHFRYAADFFSCNTICKRSPFENNEVIRILNCRTTCLHQFIVRIFFLLRFCRIHFVNPCYGNFFFAGDRVFLPLSPFLCGIFFTPYYFHLNHLHAESSVWSNVILRCCTSQSECIKAFCTFFLSILLLRSSLSNGFICMQNITDKSVCDVSFRCVCLLVLLQSVRDSLADAKMKLLYAKCCVDFLKYLRISHALQSRSPLQMFAYRRSHSMQKTIRRNAQTVQISISLQLKLLQKQLDNCFRFRTDFSFEIETPPCCIIKRRKNRNASERKFKRIKSTNQEKLDESNAP